MHREKDIQPDRSELLDHNNPAKHLPPKTTCIPCPMGQEKTSASLGKKANNFNVNHGLEKTNLKRICGGSTKSWQVNWEQLLIIVGFFLRQELMGRKTATRVGEKRGYCGQSPSWRMLTVLSEGQSTTHNIWRGILVLGNWAILGDHTALKVLLEHVGILQ